MRADADPDALLTGMPSEAVDLARGDHSDHSATASFAPPANIAFVTSTVHSGNLGGLTGADAICQTRANALKLFPRLQWND